MKCNESCLEKRPVQGDREDREKMRQYDIQREKIAKQQAEADERAQLPVTMAREGASVDSICRTLDLSKTPYSRDYVERLVAEVSQKPEEPEPADGIIVSRVGSNHTQCMSKQIEQDCQWRHFPDKVLFNVCTHLI